MEMTKSWHDEEELADLAQHYRNQEVVYGVIRGLTERNMPVFKQGSKHPVTESVRVYQVILPNNVTGYCPVSDIREVELSPRAYGQYVGRREPFIIKGLDLENQIAVLSGTEALNQLKQEFWRSIESLSDDEVMKRTFEATVIHYNVQKRMVYLSIEGQLAYMYRSEWSWNERDAVDAQDGETVKVRIVLMDRERQILRVSRKQAMPDPFDYFKEVKIGDQIAGRISDIHPVHGVFVKVDNDAEVKGEIPRSVPNPSVGDIVTCRVKSIDFENRRGRVVVLGYPNGKKRKELGSFLYD
ncbi:hypothetical protein D7X33_19140 [Butyricicoccus sp. 1XD8-22]|nr:hypothetical protein D7X33_19140 [Butyricicoccus sp. 1XD8-22]